MADENPYRFLTFVRRENEGEVLFLAAAIGFVVGVALASEPAPVKRKKARRGKRK